MDFNAFKELIHWAKGDWQALGYQTEKYIDSMGENASEKFHVEPQERLKAVKEICSYLYPKRKAIEHSNDPDNPIESRAILSLEDLKELSLSARLASAKKSEAEGS